MKRKALFNFLQLILSCVTCSIAVNCIAIPNGFAVTGVTGLAMAIEKLTGLHYALIAYMITGVIIVGVILKMGLQEVTSILLLSALYPAVLYVVNILPFKIIFPDKLIAAAAYGLLCGAGAGIAYRIGFSYGGTDTLGKLLKHTIFKWIPLKTILFGIEVFVLAFMLLVFDFDNVVYAFIGQLFYIYSMNHIIFNIGPKLYEIQIVGNQLDHIEWFIIHDIKKTSTIHSVIGGYSGKPQKQIDLVCTSRDYLHLKEFIKFHKTECFIKVYPLMHVFGQNKDFLNIEEEQGD